MTKGINLLPQIKRDQSHVKIIVQGMRFFSITLLFVVTVSSVMVFLLKLQLPISRLQQEEKKLQSDLALLHNRRVKYFVLNDRLQNISTVMAKRSNLEKLLNLITQEIPSKSVIESLKVDAKQVSLNITSSSLTPLNTYLDNLLAKNSQQKTFKKVSLDTLIFDNKRKVYTLTFLAEL